MRLKTPFFTALICIFILNSTVFAAVKISPAKPIQFVLSQGLSGFVSSYLSSGISSPFSTTTATSYADSTYETFYWPWCFEDSSGNLRLKDPANLYGCASGTCACTGDEAPIDMRDHLDSDLGEVSVDANGHFQVGGKIRRYFGTVYMNWMSAPDMTRSETWFCKETADGGHDVDCPWQAELLAKRFAVTGNNLIRMHHIDHSPLIDGDAVDGDTLSDLSDFIQMMSDEKIAVDLNLHTIRQFEESSSAPADAIDGDGLLSREELYCSENSSVEHQSKNFVYVSDDLLGQEQSWASGLLAGMPRSSATSLASHPGVAMIEITNENPFTLFYAGNEENMAGLPEATCEEEKTMYGSSLTPYWAAELERDWQDWLEDKYGTMGALETAWTSTTATDLLSGHNGDFESYNPGSDSSLRLGSATDPAYSGSATVRKLFSNWDVSNKNSYFSTVTAECDTSDCSDSSRRVQIDMNHGTSSGGWSYADFYLVFMGYGSADATGLITDYNVDADADGTVESDEALTLTGNQTVQVKMTYRLVSYADDNGGHTCTPQARAWLRDDSSGSWVMDEAYSLNTDTSGGWYEYQANLTPATDYADAQIKIGLGSDCLSVGIEVAEVNLYRGAIYGLKTAEVDFSDVEIIPYEDRSLMSDTRWEDTVRFFMSKEEAYYAAMRKTVRDAGFKGPVENSNCFYDMPNFSTRDTTLSSADYSGSDHVFTDSHAYWDSGWQDDADGDGDTDSYCAHGKSLMESYDSADDLTSDAGNGVTSVQDNGSAATNPIVKLAHTSASGMPFLTTEFGVGSDNPYMPEGLLYLAVQSSFQDWDGLTWNSYNNSQVGINALINQYRVSYAAALDNPILSAILPMASLIARNDYAATTTPTVTVSYSDAGVINHFGGEYASNDQTVEGLPSAMALAYPMRLQAGGSTDKGAADYAAEIAAFTSDAADLKISSPDGVVTWDFSGKNFKLNADKAQVFSGFIHGKTFAAKSFAARLENVDWGIVGAVSLDDKAITASNEILVTAVSYVRNDGMESLAQNIDGNLCYPWENYYAGYDYYGSGALTAGWRGPGNDYDESAGTGYSETVFPQGVMAFDLGSTAVSAKAYAVDAIGRTSEVTLTPSSTKKGYYVMEFNRTPYAFSSDAFPAGGTLAKTPWFKIEVTRDSDADGIDDDHDPNPSRTNTWYWVNSASGTVLNSGDAWDGKPYTFLSGSYDGASYAVTGVADATKANASVFRDCQGNTSSSALRSSVMEKLSTMTRRTDRGTYGVCILNVTTPSMTSGKGAVTVPFR